jgi:hypothetical protein
MDEDEENHFWLAILAYFLGLLTPVLVFLIVYFTARLNARVGNAYTTIFCSSIATGV